MPFSAIISINFIKFDEWGEGDRQRKRFGALLVSYPNGILAGNDVFCHNIYQYCLQEMAQNNCCVNVHIASIKQVCFIYKTCTAFGLGNLFTVWTESQCTLILFNTACILSCHFIPVSNQSSHLFNGVEKGNNRSITHSSTHNQLRDIVQALVVCAMTVTTRKHQWRFGVNFGYHWVGESEHREYRIKWKYRCVSR